jgi:hypothetical protein
LSHGPSDTVVSPPRFAHADDDAGMRRGRSTVTSRTSVAYEMHGSWHRRSRSARRAEDDGRRSGGPAEIPGVDPEKDVDITIENGVRRIPAERSYQKKEENEGRTDSEFEYGSFERTMRPAGRREPR